MQVFFDSRCRLIAAICVLAAGPVWGQNQGQNQGQRAKESAKVEVFPASAAKLAKRNQLISLYRPSKIQKRGPNVVLLLADDLGYGDLGIHGSKTIPTPNIDRLGSEGVRFTNAYVTAASCSPSRAGLLTGVYQQRFGFEFNTAGAAITNRYARGLDPEAVTLANVLQVAGYRTGMFGKWHLGTQPHLHPMSRGFDAFYGFLAGAHSFLQPEEPEAFHSTVMRGKTAILEPEYLTDAIARETVAFIKKHRSRQFFAYVPFNAVHTPIEATSAYLDRFSETSDPRQRAYNAMTSALDDAVGRILDTLQKQGLEDNTMVVFVNDNGGPIYTKVQSNGPLKLGKLFLFEGGIRVPMLIKFPGRIKPSSTFDPMVSTLDLFPTICGIAGVDVPAASKLDGVDLMDFLGAPRSEVPHDCLFWSNGPNTAMREGDWKLVMSGKSVWLFNLAEDPAEKHDLSDDHAEKLEHMRAEIKKWRDAMPAPAWPSKPQRRLIQVDGKPYQLNI